MHTYIKFIKFNITRSEGYVQNLQIPLSEISGYRCAYLNQSINTHYANITAVINNMSYSSNKMSNQYSLYTNDYTINTAA